MKNCQEESFFWQFLESNKKEMTETKSATSRILIEYSTIRYIIVWA